MSTATKQINEPESHAKDDSPGHSEEHHGPAKGITRWFFTTNHKDIGTMYLWFSLAMFMTGGCMALLIRMELFQPAYKCWSQTFSIK